MVYKNIAPSCTAQEGYMTGKLLASMPYVEDARFSQTVLYVCGHDKQGAIGVIINKIFPSLTFSELLRQVEIPTTPNCRDITLVYGGAVEVSRGFVLHSPDYKIDSTIIVDDNFAVTSTLEILRTLAHGEGPKQALVALGYTGWEPYQLEQEIQDNTWMVVESNSQLVFNTSLDSKWRLAMAQIGVDPTILTLDSGHA